MPAALDRFRHVSAETVLLGLAGGVGGVLLALAGERILPAISPLELPAGTGPALTLRGLWPALAVTAVAVVLCGLPSSLQSLHIRPSALLRRASGRSSTGRSEFVRSALVIGQVSVTFLLLAGGGLLVESVIQESRFDLGFSPGKVLSLRIDLGHDSAWRTEFLHQLLQRISLIPGVEGAGAINQAPLEGISDSFRLWFPGQTYQRTVDVPTAEIRAVSAGYFQTLRTRLQQGRVFEETPAGAGPMEAVINQAMAQAYWPDRNPIGQPVSIEGPEGPLHTVVGVIRNSYYAGPDSTVRPELYLPYRSLAWPSVALLVRSETGDELLASQIRAEVRRLEPTIPPYHIAPLEQRLARLLAPRRLAALLVSVFAATGLFLMALGLYGILASSVVQRRREIGIRLALGAPQRRIFGLILRRGLALSAIGLLLGGSASLATGRFLSSLLFEVSPGSLLTHSVVPALVVIVTLAACLIPARRTLRIQPAEALRQV